MFGFFDRVAETGETIIVTKRGKPLVHVLPMSSQNGLDKSAERDTKVLRARNRRGQRTPAR